MRQYSNPIKKMLLRRQLPGFLPPGQYIAVDGQAGTINHSGMT